ncbi:unnamed protein product [Protopolystoma xenopodis]|uniref:Uncharacterized protein n=1 Tax=Protopolystoma xenopodis TaxID=117903 RepID=A0A3S5CL80_9PLAT|nr:unnamed protein product [Protopolystoma xenopodis]
MNRFRLDSSCFTLQSTRACGVGEKQPYRLVEMWGATDDDGESEGVPRSSQVGSCDAEENAARPVPDDDELDIWSSGDVGWSHPRRGSVRLREECRRGVSQFAERSAVMRNGSYRHYIAQSNCHRFEYLQNPLNVSLYKSAPA